MTDTPTIPTQASYPLQAIGVWGLRSTAALQRLVGLTSTGAWGSRTTLYLQRWLNGQARR